ncbi:hypothetical protein AVDCRST_MAG81-1804 [uncultured Synechococcales cyanobacterium]|uniref:Uncharacterized protein n=1 Tax=uncultured Synechococcales cyanobacterium TaxID=1936017 RepID=A0A6J4VCA8_9CYAN|nr:hypothetical protein AVDCRST_MAG81-1804 [uncultured Synechococcales cyanobacterium]
MDAFDPTPPDWTNSAIHAYGFCCPTCQASPAGAQQVWLNRRSPVFIDSAYRKKWQEFYQCQCGRVWWAWSSDRPPSPFTQKDKP